MGDRLADVVERLGGQPLAGQDVGDARRVGGEPLGGDPAGGARRRGSPPAGRGRPRAGVITSSPQGGGGASFSCGRPGLGFEFADRGAQRRDQPLARRRGRLAEPEDRDDDVLRVELEVDPVRVEDLFRQPVAGRAGAADVDREPQRVPAGDPGPADHRLVEDARGRGSATICARVRATAASVSPSSSTPWTAACRRAASSEPVSRPLGLVVSTRLTQRSTIAGVDPAAVRRGAASPPG